MKRHAPSFASQFQSFLTLVHFSDLTEGTEDPSNVVDMEATPDLPPGYPHPTPSLFFLLILAPCGFAVPLCGERALARHARKA